VSGTGPVTFTVNSELNATSGLSAKSVIAGVN
jgi:hypothetical protein